MQASNDEPAARPKSADGRIQITPPGEGGDNGVGVNEPKAEVMSKVKHASPRTATMAFPSRAVPLSKKFLGLDPSADEVDSVVIHDVHWWTNDADVVMLCEQIGFQIDNKDVLFMEHKVNGKSKGQAVINCHSKDNAIKLNNWFHLHTFQGKKIPSALASSALGNPLHPSNQDFPTVRPLSTALHSAVHHPTNSHGGVNFNRVAKTSRVGMHPANLGMGFPPNRGYTSGGYGAPNTQGMMMGTLPMDPAIAWSSQQPDYQMGNYGQ
ncbi:hypothetical protein CI109_100402 [Kwoniella shandongensis]|uniref:Uncharacterized protein n=1 Tax=Kwoniella shandongensis TaxID=1734106 RepID=A0A5M6C8S7_9TREE|nr:uncharacterized protein CI109_001755 [Kwoniella shandongensis]KAA5529815.1 hypothetical protein CI109_001755 [Kwoniella shandongensis]